VKKGTQRKGKKGGNQETKKGGGVPSSFTAEGDGIGSPNGDSGEWGGKNKFSAKKNQTTDLPPSVPDLWGRTREGRKRGMPVVEKGGGGFFSKDLLSYQTPQESVINDERDLVMAARGRGGKGDQGS